MARDTKSAFLRELKRIAPTVSEAFEAAIVDISSSAKFSAIADAIKRGDVEAVILALQLKPEFFAPLDRAIEAVFYAGGSHSIKRIPKAAVTGAGGGVTRAVVRFQGRHPRAEDFVRRRVGDLIVSITENQRNSVRKVIEAGLKDGRNPNATALDLVGRLKGNQRVGGMVGLTPHRIDQLIAKRRRLTDQGRPKREIEKIIQGDTSRALRVRGRAIARTETIHALNAGRWEGMQQAVDSGAVDAGMIKVRWSATMDKRTRDYHSSMHGQVIKFGGAFTSPSGARLRFPGDTSLGAGAADVINCRCFAYIEVNYLDMAA